MRQRTLSSSRTTRCRSPPAAPTLAASGNQCTLPLHPHRGQRGMYREPSWPGDLGTFDAIVTLQAAHETRHKRHLVPLLTRARTVAAPGGVLLYADHYLTPETKLPALVPARADQPLALERAGFVDVQLRHEEGNMALWCGTNPIAASTSR